MGQLGIIRLIVGAVILCLSQNVQASENHPRMPRLLLFSGADMSSSSAFAHAGMRYATTGDLDNGGIVAELLVGYGTYDYANDGSPLGFVEGRAFLAHAAAGYQFRLPRAGVALLLGAQYQKHGLSAPDPANPVQGGSAGALAIADAWARPRDWLLLSAYASQSTAFRSGYARLRASIDTPIQDWTIGPELAVSYNEDYRQFRAGAFVEGPYLRIMRVGLAAGYSRGQDGDDGFYLGAFNWRKF